jgi:hypothetical protein
VTGILVPPLKNVTSTGRVVFGERYRPGAGQFFPATATGGGTGCGAAPVDATPRLRRHSRILPIIAVPPASFQL